MAKPRVFIGSSVEGLNVAYAVQQNLLHVAEVTVWDQGVFELSRTTMESLTTALGESDFSIFVFSPDDLTKIRNKTSRTVRDNVLFEFGLFIGKLGRERVFFLLPSKGDLHIPTDLLGVTPGRYETDRTDGSMQAATGGVCHQIRNQIKKAGPLPGRAVNDGSGEASSGDSGKVDSWITHFLEKRFDKAIAMLEAEAKNLSGEDVLSREAWIIYCRAKKEEKGAIAPLEEFLSKHDNSARIQRVIAHIVRTEGHPTKAIDLLLSAQTKFPNDERIARELAKCRLDDADSKTAIEELQRFGTDESPSMALDLADIYESNDDKDSALRTILRCYENHPSHEGLRFKLAKLSHDLDHHTVAAYLLNGLTEADSESIDYWGYLGNACLVLDLNDIALHCYRKAESLMERESNSQWIVANIGNVFINRGFPTEARAYLDRAIKYEPDSEYAHGRLASALSKSSEERKEFKKKISEGRRNLREMTEKISISSQVSDLDLVSAITDGLSKTPKT